MAKWAGIGCAHHGNEDKQGKRMKINVYAADLGGCGRYRLIHAAMVLKEQGHDIKVFDPNKPMDIAVNVDFATGEVLEVSEPDADILVMQRVTSAPHVQAMTMLRKKGYTVVLDLDDDMTRIHPGNAAFRELDPTRKRRMSWMNTSLAAQEATLVTVSTKALASVYGSHGRVQVVDNYIPARYLELAHTDNPTYGWPGSTESHPNDLPVVGNAARKLEEMGFPFYQVGPNQPMVDKQLGFTRHLATGPIKLSLWPASISLLGVAWAPLADTLFNASKSRLKILEANSVGVPYVASPRAEYVRMSADGGAGMLADTPKEWFRKTERLLTDHRLRQDLSLQARAYAATQTIEDHAWRTMDAWQRAYHIQHKGARILNASHIDLGAGRMVAAIPATKEETV